MDDEGSDEIFSEPEHENDSVPWKRVSYASYAKAVSVAKKTGKTANVKYVLQTSDSSDADGEDNASYRSPSPIFKRRKMSMPSNNSRKIPVLDQNTSHDTGGAADGELDLFSKERRCVSVPNKGARSNQIRSKANTMASSRSQSSTTTARRVILGPKNGQVHETGDKHVAEGKSSAHCANSPVINTPQLQSSAKGSSDTDLMLVSSLPLSSSTPRRPKETSNVDVDVVQELQKTNQLMGEILHQMQKTERRVEAIEDKLHASSSSSSSSSTKVASKKKRQKEIPNDIKRETKRVYHMLRDEDESFQGWTIAPGVTYRSQVNKQVVSRLVREVKGLNPEFKTDYIEGAAYTYYTSCCASESAARRGVTALKLTQKRRHERLSRKLQERHAALAKMVFTDEKQRERWLCTMRIDMMSSEESGQEGDSEVMIVKTLPWRSEQVDRLLKQLDLKICAERTSQARRQTIPRVVSSEPSSRPYPHDETLPSWLFKE